MYRVQGLELCRVWNLLKKARAHKNLLKIQLGINKCEKNNTFYLKMRKVASNLLMLNQPTLGSHCVKNIKYQKLLCNTNTENS